MSGTPETLVDIAAEIRHGERMFWSLRDCAAYADRIEAAAERERVKARHDAAEMREALVEILNRTNREKSRDYDAALNGGILEIHDIANIALNETKGE